MRRRKFAAYSGREVAKLWWRPLPGVVAIAIIVSIVTDRVTGTLAAIVSWITTVVVSTLWVSDGDGLVTPLTAPPQPRRKLRTYQAVPPRRSKGDLGELAIDQLNVDPVRRGLIVLGLQTVSGDLLWPRNQNAIAPSLDGQRWSAGRHSRPARRVDYQVRSSPTCLRLLRH